MLFKSFLLTLAVSSIARSAVIDTRDSTEISALNERTPEPIPEISDLEERSEDIELEARAPEPEPLTEGLLAARAPALLTERAKSRQPVCGGSTVAACCQVNDPGPTTGTPNTTSPTNTTSPGNTTNTTKPTNSTLSTRGTGLNCLSPGNPTSLTAFRKVCARTGRSADCCATLAGGKGTGCQDV